MQTSLYALRSILHKTIGKNDASGFLCEPQQHLCPLYHHLAPLKHRIVFCFMKHFHTALPGAPRTMYASGWRHTCAICGSHGKHHSVQRTSTPAPTQHNVVPLLHATMRIDPCIDRTEVISYSIKHTTRLTCKKLKLLQKCVPIILNTICSATSKKLLFLDLWLPFVYVPIRLVKVPKNEIQ